MSRTRKDTPHRVFANDRTLWRGEDHSAWAHHRTGECDVNETVHPGKRRPSCEHTLAWAGGSVVQAHEKHRCQPGPANRRSEYWKPDRRSTRDTLHKAAADWNDTGSIDEDTVPVRRPRTGPWAGGYWD